VTPESLLSLDDRQAGLAALSAARPTEISRSATHSTTFVCCIESGSLEDMTVRMAASLRAFGGRLADAPVIAVQPRRGVGLRAETRRSLDQYGVTLVRETSANPRPWNSFFNKLGALAVGDRLAETDTVCWLDSDLLVLGEPQRLDLAADEDFAACPSDNCGATTGPEDKNEAYWNLLITLAGLKLADFPWLTNCQGTRVRTYFNSGVFAYRRGCGLLDHYPALCDRLLMSGYKSPVTGVFFTDQVALGVSAVAAGLRIQSLPLEYNYPVGSRTEQPYSPDWMSRAVIVHYHGALCPDYWSTMLAQLERDRPDAYRWLKPWGPVTGKATLGARVVRKVLREYRRRRCERFARGCREIHATA
jgi:hypothetical protein